MALTYRNKITGAVNVLPEPGEILASAQDRAEALMRVGTKKARLEAEQIEADASWQVKWQTQNLARIDECGKWERWHGPVPASGYVTDADIAAAAAAKVSAPSPDETTDPDPAPAKKATARKAAAEPAEPAEA